jgi:16S rRNA processing protein RimM
MASLPTTRVLLGHITAAYGIQGWVKVHSSTDPVDNIFDYQPWQIRLASRWHTVALKRGRRCGNMLIAQLDGCEDRDKAKCYFGADIAVDQSQLPSLESGDYYWQQLIGLMVETRAGVRLGRVDRLMATGANDVLIVQGQEDCNSIDLKQRLIPWIPEQVIINIDTVVGTIQVDWDPDF